MAERHAAKSRHKEYSLISAGVAAVILLAYVPEGTAALGVLTLFAIASVVWSAFSVVRHADVLAHRFGEPYGSLILSLSIVFLEVSLISILMLTGAAGATMMRDTIYSVLTIVLGGFTGLALLLGGAKYKTQNFNLTGIKHFLISIIPLAVIVLALPTALGTGVLSSPQLLIVSFICLGMYAVFLRIQMFTHRDFFVYEDEDDDGHHGKPSAHGNAWHFFFLAVHLVAVIGVTKLSSAGLYRLLDVMHAPPALPGFLVALLILSPEGTGAFKAILHDQVQRAMNLLLGSVLATISLTVPAVSVIAIMTGQELVLGLSVPDIVVMLTTLMLCQVSLTRGESNAHNGAAHLAVFIAYLMLLFA